MAKAKISVTDIYAGILAVQSILIEKGICTEEELSATIYQSEQMVAEAMKHISTNPTPHGDTEHNKRTADTDTSKTAPEEEQESTEEGL